MTLFPPGTPQHSFCWQVVRRRTIDDDKVSSTRKRQDDDWIGIYLYVKEPSPFTLDLYTNLKVDLYKDNLFTQFGDQRHDIRLKNLTNVPCGWGYRFLPLSDATKYLDPEGSLNLKVAADFYLATDGIAEIIPQGDVKDVPTCVVVASEVESRKMRTDILLSQVASLLGDEVSSDVILSVVHMESNVVIGTVYCHAAILSGKCQQTFKIN